LISYPIHFLLLENKSYHSYFIINQLAVDKKLSEIYINEALGSSLGARK